MMKRILLATALIAATATVAAASPSINELPQTKAFEVRLKGFEVLRGGDR